MNRLHTQPDARYTARKPKGPVFETTFSEAVATPTDKRGFVTPKFWGWCVCTAIMVSGGMGLPVRMAARLRTCVSTSRPPAAIEAARGGFLAPPEGAKTMTANPSAQAAQSPTTSYDQDASRRNKMRRQRRAARQPSA